MRCLFFPLFFAATVLCCLGAPRGFLLKGQFPNKGRMDVLLAYHNGLGLALFDSLRVDTNGVMHAPIPPTLPGIYTLVFPTLEGRKVSKEIVLDKDSVIEFKADEKGHLIFGKGTDNGIFYDMVDTLNKLNERGSGFAKILREGKFGAGAALLTKEERKKYADSLEANEKAIGVVITDFKRAHPTHILSLIHSLRSPKTLSMPRLQTAADSAAYRLALKRNFFNSSVWKDERIRRLGAFYNYLNVYFGGIVENKVDTLQYYVSELAAAIIPNNYPLFQDFANYIYMKYVRYGPFIGSDAVFYSLYMKYINEDESEMANNIEGLRLKQRGEMLVDNQIYMPAPSFRLLDFKTHKPMQLSNIQGANFYLLCFWDPECRHCRVAIPKVDSMMFQAKIASTMGIKVVGVTLEEEHGLSNFIQQNHLSPEWIQLFDNRGIRENNLIQGIKDVRLSYGLLQTPTFYLLDRNKRIIAKNMRYDQIPPILQILKGAKTP